MTAQFSTRIGCGVADSVAADVPFHYTWEYLDRVQERGSFLAFEQRDGPGRTCVERFNRRRTGGCFDAVLVESSTQKRGAIRAHYHASLRFFLNVSRRWHVADIVCRGSGSKAMHVQGWTARLGLGFIAEPNTIPPLSLVQDEPHYIRELLNGR